MYSYKQDMPRLKKVLVSVIKKFLTNIVANQKIRKEESDQLQMVISFILGFNFKAQKPERWKSPEQLD